MLPNWLRRTFSRTQTPVRRTPSKTQLMLESLDVRDTPALTGIGFSINPVTTVSGVVMPNFETTVTGTPPLAGHTVTLSIFSGPGGFAAGTTSKNTVGGGITNFGNIRIDRPGTYIIRASVTDGATFTVDSPAFNITASQLRITQAPAAVFPATNFPVTVQAVGVDDNLDPNFSENVTLSVSPGNPSTLGGTFSGALVGGQQIFGSVQLTGLGLNRLRAVSATTFTTPVLAPNTTKVVAPTSLAFISQPLDTISNQNISAGNVQVEVRDQDDEGIPMPGISVTVAKNSGPGNFFAGTLTQATNGAGVATFNDLRIRTTGTYVLSATSLTVPDSPGNDPAISDPFNITASKLVMTSVPTAALGGVPFAVTVQAQGTDDSVDPNFDGETITIGKTGGSPSTLGGTLTGVMTDGTITLSNIILSGAGGVNTLTAKSSVTFPAPVLAPNTTTLAVATTLEFVSQPTDTVSGQEIADFSVRVLDQFNNPFPVAGLNVGLAVQSGPGAIFSGTNPRATNASGVATFDNIVIQRAGSYVLRANVGAITVDSDSDAGTAGNQPFRISAAQLVINAAGAPDKVRSGQLFDVVARAEGVDGNLDPNFTGPVTLSLNSGPGTIINVAADDTVVAGLATFANVQLATGGLYKFQATSPGLTTGIDAGTTKVNASSIVFLTTPGSVTLGAGAARTATAVVDANLDVINVTVEGRDANNAPADIDANVTLALNSAFQDAVDILGAGTLVFGGTKTIAVGNATQAVYDAGEGLIINRWGQYRVQAAAANVAPPGGYAALTLNNPSNVFEMKANQLAFTTQPPATRRAGQQFNPTAVTVTARDAIGDVDLGFDGADGDSVTLGLQRQGAGPAGQFNGNVTSVIATAGAVVDGVATYSTTLSILTGGTFKLTASNTFLPQVLSNNIKINASQAVIERIGAPRIDLTGQVRSAAAVADASIDTFNVKVVGKDALGVDADLASDITLELVTRNGVGPVNNAIVGFGGNHLIVAPAGNNVTFTGQTLASFGNYEVRANFTDATIADVSANLNVFGRQLLIVNPPLLVLGPTAIQVRVVDALGAIDTNFSRLLDLKFVQLVAGRDPRGIVGGLNTIVVGGNVAKTTAIGGTATFNINSFQPQFLAFTASDPQNLVLPTTAQTGAFQTILPGRRRPR